MSSISFTYIGKNPSPTSDGFVCEFEREGERGLEK